MNLIKKNVCLYYAISLFFTWALWIGAMVYGIINKISIPYNEGFFKIITEGFSSNKQMFAYIIFSLAVYGPLISSLILRKKLVSNSVTNRVEERPSKLSGRWILLILIYPIILFSIGVIASMVTTGFSQALVLPKLPLWFMPVLIIHQMLSSGTEEFGWRGYMQVQFQKIFNAEKTCYIVGILWSIWHFPFIIYTNLQGGATAILLSLVGFVLLTIPQAFVIGFIYNSTKSVLLCVFFHAYANSISFYILAMAPNVQMATIGVAVLTWLVANYLSKKFGKDKLSYKL